MKNKFAALLLFGMTLISCTTACTSETQEEAPSNRAEDGKPGEHGYQNNNGQPGGHGQKGINGQDGGIGGNGGNSDWGQGGDGGNGGDVD